MNVTRAGALQELQSGLWAINPEALASMTAALTSPAPLTADRLAAGGRSSARTMGSVAVLPLWGVVTQRDSFLSMLFGGTSTTGFAQQFRQALADPQVSGIVLSVDSPGGTVPGVPELADEIYRARGRKPITAVADGQMASAAYWIGSAADTVVASPSSELGSIGVYSGHVDTSGAMAKEGVKVTLVSAGRRKTEGNPYEPLTTEARAAMQSRVEDIYAMFVGAVAKGRGVPVADVRGAKFGEGRTMLAQPAVRAGLADRVGTLDSEITRLLRSPSPSSGSKALAGAFDELEIHRRRLRLYSAAAGIRRQ